MINFRPLCEKKIIEPRETSIYRSGELVHLTHSEINNIVEDLGISYYIDLRSEAELTKRGRPLTLIKAGVHWQSFPIQDEDHYFRTKPFPNFYDYFDSYIGLLQNNEQQLKKIFIFLSENYDARCVIGCFAGKDRTGLVAILFMMLLGFTTEDIIHDYVESGRYLTQNIDYFEESWIKKGWTKEHYIHRLTPNSKTALLVIEYITEKYGNIDGYLENLGMQPKDCLDMLTYFRNKYRFS